MTFEVFAVAVPIRTSSPNGGNPGNRWAAIMRSREDKAQREAVKLALGARLRIMGRSGRSLLPCVVTMTRVSAGTLDPHDNLPMSLKHCTDQIAEVLGLPSDRDPQVEWHFAQHKASRGVWGIVIRIEPKDQDMKDQDLDPRVLERARNTLPDAYSAARVQAWRWDEERRHRPTRLKARATRRRVDES